MGAIAVLGGRGDTQIRWDAADQASVDKAKAEFDSLLAKGCSFFRNGRRVKKFDPAWGEADVSVPAIKAEVVGVRPMRGG